MSDPLVKISSKHSQSQTGRAKELKFWENVHPKLCVLCHVSFVMCLMSHVTCRMSLGDKCFFFLIFFTQNNQCCLYPHLPIIVEWRLLVREEITIIKKKNWSKQVPPSPPKDFLLLYLSTNLPQMHYRRSFTWTNKKGKMI